MTVLLFLALIARLTIAESQVPALSNDNAMALQRELIMMNFGLSQSWGQVGEVIRNSTQNHIMLPCKAYLEAFAQHTALFTKCLIENARPFRFCESCVDHFQLASAVFDDLSRDSTCQTKILTADRVQVVRLVYKNMKSVWDSASCQACFQNISIDKENGTVTFNLTASTQEFLDLFQNMSTCLNYTIQEIDLPGLVGNESMCSKCKTQYEDLNSLFVNIMEAASLQACMDVVDMMNYTRLMWSRTYNCSHRKGDIGPVLVITCCVCALPVIFYIANRVTGARREPTIVKQKRMKFPKPNHSYGTITNHEPSAENRLSVTT